MKRKYALISCLLLFIAQSIWAAKVDTVVTYSQSMHKEIKAIVITPKDYSSEKPFPVVYLLHGYGDNYRQWYTQAGDELKEAADQYHMIIVCPDGNVSSWYMDSPVDPAWKYETYVSGELVKWIDQKYATIANRSGRAITGLSMGGHGALYLAFRHQDIYGAAGSMSGGVDLRPFPLKWNLSERLGDYASHPENWEKNSVINLVHLLTPNSLKLIIDCGTDDFFYKVNCNLHEKLLERYIPHDFITRPGAHNWPYWINSINYQLLFMHRYFEGKK